VVRGNPELQPETSHNLSLGGELSAGRYYARAQLFYNRFADFIETYVAGDSSGLSLYSYGNIEAGVTRGFEVETNTTWRGARLELGYSYLDARNRATDERLLGRPTHAAHGSAAYTLPFGGRVSVTAVYTGSTPLERAASALREREAYTRMDARIARTVIDAFELSVGVENVFDRTPADWPGFTGRQAHIGMSWRPYTIRNDYEETR
jgi:outer membrane receptor protein involved in Fe transport